MAEDSQWGAPEWHWGGKPEDQVYEHLVPGTSTPLRIKQNSGEQLWSREQESSDIGFVNGLVVWDSAIDLVR